MATTAKRPTRRARKSTKVDDRPVERQVEAPGDGNAEAGRLTPEQRLEFISVAAYYRAEGRCFAPGCEEDDWLAAEQEIDAAHG